MIYYSNCKINIGLNILNRRADGYHNIKTIFYPINGLCDAIEIIDSRSGTQFSVSGIDIDVLPSNNLCMRAYNAVKERYDIGEVLIHLHKNIPTGAGLGGGSANAATIIKALNEKFTIGMTIKDMKSIGSTLGSDVAFFIENTPMLGEGRGELLSTSNLSLRGYYISIVKPSCHVSTRAAYSSVEPQKPIFDLKDINLIDLGQWRDLIVNDFENPIFVKFPELLSLKKAFYRENAIYVSMSGSGSSVFAISEEPIDLERFKSIGICHSEVCLY